MCARRKRFVTAIMGFIAASFIFSPACAADVLRAGGVAVGDSQGGVTDRAFVTAPPHFAYVVEREPGSFLDCGEGLDQRATDADGRDMAGLRCGVTLTETLIIPTAAASARVIVHF